MSGSYMLWITLILSIWTNNVFGAPYSVDPLTQRALTHESGGDEHIVIVSTSAPHVPDVLKRIALTPEHNDVRYIFKNSAFRGFSARMQSHCLDALSKMGDVLHVEKSTFIQSFAEREHQLSDSTWGLERISTSSAPFGDSQSLSFTYSYPWNSTLGKDVDVYVVDTGINVENIVFGGRARMGFSFSSDSADHDGHGTHVSGTAGGYVFGVASAANIIGVKVLGNDGSGSTADTLAGMDYVMNNHDSRKAAGDGTFKGSIMSMSWGLGSVSSAIQTAINAALSHGVHVSMAAGNSADDACHFSPSAAGGSKSAAISVGSIGPSGDISSFSNTGPCVDVYAPGEDVLSAWIGGDNVVNYLSGTSMATPHVTGVMAAFLGDDGSGAFLDNPSALKNKVLSTALTGMVQANDGTVSGGKLLLLNNGVSRELSGSNVQLGGSGGSTSSKRLVHRKNASLRERQAIASEERVIRRLWSGKMPLSRKYTGRSVVRY